MRIVDGGGQTIALVTVGPDDVRPMGLVRSAPHPQDYE